MNVALFASAFHPHVGGVEELVRQLAHEYRRQGLGVIVVTNQWPRSLPEYEEYEGIPTYRLPMRVPEGSLKARLNYRLTHAHVRERMLQILRERQIDILHVQCVSSNGYYALLGAEALGLPLIVTAQGERTMDAGQIYQRSTFMNRILRELLVRADAITACSQNTLDDLEQYSGEPLGSRASVVYNGIQPSDFTSIAPFAHPRPYILGIGRLVPQKGFDVLIRAFAAANVRDYDLQIAGVGPEAGALAQLSESLDVKDRVHFFGRADRASAVALFKGCSFFVLPSRQEPMGIVSLEAMAAGKAVIASKVGGVPEIVLDQETGLLVRAEDVIGLAAAIAKLAGNVGLRHRLGSAGSSRSATFAWSQIAARYIQVYTSVHLVRCGAEGACA